MIAEMDNGRNKVKWQYDEFGFIVPFDARDPYVGCRVALHTVVVGQHPGYHLPTGQFVTLKIPVVRITPSL